MKMPDIITQTRNPTNNFTFRVLAYRKLNPKEMRLAFSNWNRQRDKRHSLKNKIVEVTSIIGYDD